MQISGIFLSTLSIFGQSVTILLPVAELRSHEDGIILKFSQSPGHLL